MPSTKPLIACAIAAAAASHAQADTILAIEAISSPDYIPFSFPLIGAINQAGLSANYVSGVTDYDTFVATTTHAGGSANTVFVNSNAQNQPNGVVELFGTFALNLGSAQRVDAFAIWNSGNRPDMLIDFELYADTDGNFANGGTTLLGDYSIDATNTAITLPFPVTTGQFFHIRLTGHDGTDFLLLGEFAFRESICPADFSGDGAVDATDLAILLAAWSSEGATDLNSDGVTNAADLAILLAAWGMCPQ